MTPIATWLGLLIAGAATASWLQSPTTPPRTGEVDWDRAQTQPAAWFASDEALRIADRVLRYQRHTGGWPKNVDMAVPLTAETEARLARERAVTDSTIDNGATVSQIRFLAAVHQARKGPAHVRGAVDRAIRYLLEAQYPAGGWPQYFPLRNDYSRHVTFNDNAMIGVMDLLDDVNRGRSPFQFVDALTRERAGGAVARGRQVVLASQIRVGGTLTGWCQQHDAVTLAPAGARTYEHPSISGQETVGIVRHLMRIERPGPAVVAAIEGAVAWLRSVTLHGLRLVRRPDASAPDGTDVVVVPDPAAPPLWARFYEIGTNRPIYSGRDGVVRYAMSEIEIERRSGYSWLGPYAADLLGREYAAWKGRENKR